MDSALNFAMETSSQSALVVCDNSSYAETLRAGFNKHSIDCTVASSSAFFSAPERFAPGELDYLVIWVDPGLQSLLESGRGAQSDVLAALSPYCQLFLLSHLRSRSHLTSLFPTAKFVFYSDFLGDSSSDAPSLDAFLDSCRQHKMLTLPGDGLGSYSLLHEHDLLAGIEKFLFSPLALREVILSHPEPVSLLSLAYEIRSHLPFKIDILFSESSPWDTPDLDWTQVEIGQTKLKWRPLANYTSLLPAYIDRIFESAPAAPYVPPRRSPSVVIPLESVETRPQPTRPRLTPLRQVNSAPVFVPQSRPKITKKVPLRRPRLGLRLPSLPSPARVLLNSLLIAVVAYLFTLAVSLTITYLSVRSLTSLTPASARSALPPAVYLQANLTALGSLPGLGRISAVNELNQLFSAYILGLRTLSDSSNLTTVGRDLTAYIFGAGEGDLAVQLNVASLETAELYDNLSLLDGSLPLDPPGIIPAGYRESYLDLKLKLAEARRAALTAKSLLAVAPDLLGVGTRRKYVVLFQNNMELRPTGGFIGSFAELSLENGKLFDVQVQDVYSADGQLKGHVEPPEEIKRYLGEANWYLRDSNWDPDFPTTARRVEWFLDKTIGLETNGTFAINVNTLQDVLRAHGPLQLLDYDEEVTADNIFERAEYHSEVSFFPGSTQKKEFLSSVADALLTELSNLEPDKILAYTHALTKSIDEKHTLFSVQNSATARTLSTLGWTGEIRESPCPDFGGNCTSDFAMLVDSNFGVNKANYFLKRSLDLDVEIDKNLAVSHSLTATYTNTSTSGSWPAGPYKNYSRLYLPEDSILESISVGDRQLDPADIKLSTDHGRLVIGFLVEVPLDTTLAVTSKYSLVTPLASTAPTYSLYWQKQSGTAPDPLVVKLSYPLFLEPEIVSPKAVLNSQQLQFNLSNITDRRLTVKFK